VSAAKHAPNDVTNHMGTSIAMIERSSYGALIVGAREGIAARLDDLEERLGQDWATGESER
jgi:hypothetical protein